MTEQHFDQTDLGVAKKRNYGIDILKALSMFMVTLLHFIGFGGFFKGPESGFSFYVFSAFYIICYVATDIFAVISGYVSYGSKTKYERITGLWLQVVFYSLSLSFADMLLFHTSYNYFSLLMPVTFSNLWYFRAYFFMFFFIPFYNTIIDKLSNKDILKFIIIGIIVFCFCSGFLRVTALDELGLKNGYSFLWLSFCYIAGAFLKKNEAFIKKHITSSSCLIIILICFILNYLTYTLLFKFPAPGTLKLEPKGILLYYNSVSFFIPAICALILFSRVKIKHGKKLIKILSSTSFSVYIIQLHPVIWNRLMGKWSSFFGTIDQVKSIALVIGGAIGLYLAATLVDFLRIQLFKILHIDSLCTFICKVIKKIIDITSKPLKKWINQ